MQVGNVAKTGKFRPVVFGLLFTLLMCGAVEQHALGVRVLHEVSLDAAALTAHQQMRTVEVLYGNRVTLGKFYAIGIYDYMQAQIDKLSADNLHAASIVCVAADGRTVSLSMAEVHPSLCQSPARLLIGEAKATQRGEVFMEADVESDFDDGSIDFGKLTQLTDPLILERLLLPHLVIDKQRAAEVKAAEMVLMTTNDVQAHRWIGGVSTIYLVMHG